MATEIEALIRRRSRELAALLNGRPLSGVKGYLRRKRAQRLRADLLELIALRRRFLELASGSPHGARHTV